MSRVVIVGQGLLLPELVEQLTNRWGAVRLPSPGEEREAFLAEQGDEVRVLITSSMVGADAALMDRLPRLELIATYGVGYDSVDVESATARGIVVTNTPDVLNDCVADLAVGLLIDVMRGVTEADRFVRARRWGTDALPLRRRVTGAKVGILGLGRIGLEIATRLEGFRCDICYSNRSPRDDVAYEYMPSARELAQWCDVLVVATPGGAATEALVDGEVLHALGPQGYLVNIARGSVVDETVLVEALVAGEIAGAGLDVFAHEPRIPEALFNLDNVVSTPHIASATEETRNAMAAVVLDNLAAWGADARAVTPVN